MKTTTTTAPAANLTKYQQPPTSPLAALVGTIVGKVRINTPRKGQQLYECAAWYSNAESETGIFPLILREDYYNKDSYFLTADLPGKITACSFTALFCGNPIPGARDSSADRIGGPQNVGFRIDLPAAYKADGISPGNAPFDIALAPELLQPALDHYTTRAHNQAANTAYWLAEGKMDMIQAAGRWTMENAEAACQLETVARYRRAGFLKECKAANTAWSR